MSPLAALLVLVEQGSPRRQLRDVLEGCAWGCADRPLFRRTGRRDERGGA